MIENIPKKSLYSFGAYALIFGAIIFFVLQPTLVDIENNKKSIVEQNKQLAANYDEIASYQKIEKDKAGFELIKNTVFGYLPTSLDSSQFIVEVEGLAKKTNVTIDSVTMSATSTTFGAKKTAAAAPSDDAGDKKSTDSSSNKKTKGGTQQNSFVLSTKADFASSMSFIQQMEKLSRFNSITSVTIAPNETGVDIKLTGDIFYEQQ